ncbi:unnamed protein product [Closterium sp. NIES-54]
MLNFLARLDLPLLHLLTLPPLSLYGRCSFSMEAFLSNATLNTSRHHPSDFLPTLEQHGLLPSVQSHIWSEHFRVTANIQCGDKYFQASPLTACLAALKKGFLPSPFNNFKTWEATSLLKLFNCHFPLKSLNEHPNIQGLQGTSPLKPFNSHFPFKTFSNQTS